MKKLVYNYKDFFKSIILILLSALFIKFFIWGIYYTSGNSMLPNIPSGSLVIINRTAYGVPIIQSKTTPPVGDIIAFESDSGDVIIKRVIASENNKIEWHPGVWVVNEWAYPAQANSPKWINDRLHLNDIPISSVSMPVPTGSVMVIGDNFDDSYDSRDFGFVKNTKIIGRVDRVFDTGF